VVAAGAPTILETAIVLVSRLPHARTLLNDFLSEAEVEIIPFTREHYDAALDAFERYGKARHRAALNFGDCMSYAIARISGLPLLFTGRDFQQTDVLRVDH
jgi:ribonuclease VapC